MAGRPPVVRHLVRTAAPIGCFLLIDLLLGWLLWGQQDLHHPPPQWLESLVHHPDKESSVCRLGNACLVHLVEEVIQGLLMAAAGVPHQFQKSWVVASHPELKVALGVVAGEGQC